MCKPLYYVCALKSFVERNFRIMCPAKFKIKEKPKKNRGSVYFNQPDSAPKLILFLLVFHLIMKLIKEIFFIQ